MNLLFLDNKHPHQSYRFSTLIMCLSVMIGVIGWESVWAEDWTTFRHDNRRSGITQENASFPLREIWSISSFIPPQTAWTGPAKWDAYANLIELKPMRDFDPVFYTTVAGQRVFWGSSVDDAVHCVDLLTGNEQWVFCTGGPVRIAPTVDREKVYCGSDDGYIYCINAETGKLVWSYKPSPDSPLIPSNGKFISPWPCRTGAFVQDGIVYFAASLLPWKESYLCAIDAETGSDKGEGLFVVRHDQSAMQGPIVASSLRMYLSHGRQQPHVYDLKTGHMAGKIGKSGDGGCFALLTPDDLLIQGQGQNHAVKGELRGFNAQTVDRIATFPMANCIIIQGDFAYLHSNGVLAALNRTQNIALQTQKFTLEKQVETAKKQLKTLNDPKGETDEGKKILQQIEDAQNSIQETEAQINQTFLWKQDVSFYHSMILAGDTLIMGGKNLIAAHEAATGQRIWSQAVQGNAHGLTYANGHLLVSTDRGEILCYTKPSKPSEE